MIEELNKFYLKPTIVLFGSASEGLDTDTSDIDLLIITEKTKDFKKRKNFEKILKRKIQIITIESLKKIKNKHLLNNIINGIILQGKIRWT